MNIFGIPSIPTEEIWNESEEEEEDDAPNETPIKPIDSTFTDKIAHIKRTLYNSIILAPPLGSRDAQSDVMRTTYQIKLRRVHRLCKNAEKGQSPVYQESDMRMFPAMARGPIKMLLDWMVPFFRSNSMADTLPYSDYLLQKLKVYPFDQRKSFYVE
jgi:hypothetical protein